MLRIFRATSRKYSVHVSQKSTSDPKRLARSISALLISGVGMYFWFKYEKKRIATEKLTSTNKNIDGAGKPLIGGPFSLVDCNGIPRTDLDYRGKYLLLYFGYTFCPDVCPEELEKMAKVLDVIDSKKEEFGEEPLKTLFISCDPKRDSLKSVKDYLLDFHSKFIGLTGTHEQIKKVARTYRMYYSAPPRALDDDDSDYLVDHSIFFYLLDPDGKYVCHFGRIDTEKEVTEKILEVMREDRKKI